jgi:hypothetical protein
MKNLKYLKHINESKDKEIESDFEKAYKSGSVSFNLDYYSSDWGRVKSKYHLYDEFYLYKDAIFNISTRPSGDWYHTELVKLDKPVIKFKEEILKKIDKLEEKIDKLEDAFNKIDSSL